MPRSSNNAQASRSQVEKAKKAAKAIQKGSFKRAAKIRSKPTFYRPKTKSLSRRPKYPAHAIPKDRALDKFAILRYPLQTDKAMHKMEECQTLTFVVDKRASKPQIKKAFKEAYDVDVSAVRTLIRPDGQKKAYIRLAPGAEAVQVASKMGVF